MKNITYKSIFLNGLGGPQAVGRRKRPGAIGGIHFKSGRGRGTEILLEDTDGLRRPPLLIHQ